MDLPHLNVLTKIDNLASYPPLPLSLDFYTEARSLDYILPYLEEEQNEDVPQSSRATRDPEDMDEGEDRPPSKFAALNEAIIELVDDYGLVGFETLAVEDRASMLQLLHAIDRAGGYAFGAAEGVNESVWEMAVREGGSGHMQVRDIEERWVDRRQEFDDLEIKLWEEEGKAAKRKAGVAQDLAKRLANPPSSDKVAGDEDVDEMAKTWKPPNGTEAGVKVVRK